MTDVLWELEGISTAKYDDIKDPHEEAKIEHKFVGFEQVNPGKMSRIAYDVAVSDLVFYLEWMGESAQNTRKLLGV